jgi:predicted ATP-binding protein involved in virulence
MTESSSDTNKKSTPVYFASIEVENFLCFKMHQKLDLCNEVGSPAQWTVILGDNGVGKTTLLRCLASMQPQLVDFIDSGKAINVVPRLFAGDIEWSGDFTRDGLMGQIEASFAYGSSFVPQKKDLPIAKYKKSAIGNEALELFLHGQEVFGASAVHKKQLSLIKCYGYGANRKMSSTSLSQSVSTDNTLSLFSDDERLTNAEEWLLQADYAVMKSRSPNSKIKKHFDLIQETLKYILPDITDIRISLVGDDRPKPIAEFLTPYGWVPLLKLGLGYRTVIAWIVDLSARMIRDFPNSENPLSEPAVVLVDEIDLHLHPKWQRTIMSFLTERFPNVQFIVTAHSPLVVQAARNANLVLLRREGDHVVIDNNPEIIENWRVEQVLTSVFELPSTLPADIEPLIQRRHAILGKSSLSKKDKLELKELEAKIGNLPTSESAADIRAMDIIQKAAKLLENR